MRPLLTRALDELSLSDPQYAALARLADIPAGAAFVPTPAQRDDFHALVALGLARSCGPGLGGEGFAPTPEGRQAYAASRPKSGRGFASLSPERRRQIAASGGSAVAPQNRAFAKDRALATRAGRLGGEISQRKRDAKA